MYEYKTICPEQLYICLNRHRKVVGLPFADMCEYGNLPSVSARTAQLNRKYSNYTKTIGTVTLGEPTVIDNTPQLGFSIYISGSASQVHVVDPRGFSVQTDYQHLYNILENTTITNGEILEPCIWAFYNSRAILLKQNSKLHLQAVDNADRISTFLPINAVKPGDRVLLQNGHTLQYMGKYYSAHVKYISERTAHNSHLLPCEKRNQHYFIDTSCKADGPYGINNPQVSRIVADSNQTPDQCYQEINRIVVENQNTTFTRQACLLRSRKELRSLTIALVPIAEVQDVLKDMPAWTTLVFQNNSNNHYYVSQDLENADVLELVNTGNLPNSTKYMVLKKYPNGIRINIDALLKQHIIKFYPINGQEPVANIGKVAPYPQGIFETFEFDAINLNTQDWNISAVKASFDTQSGHKFSFYL